MEQHGLHVGAFVFCTLKGYRPWPAKIKSIDYRNNIAFYSVKFYGTYDYANCREKALVPFTNESRELAINYSNGNQRMFLMAVDQMDEDIQECTERESAKKMQRLKKTERKPRKKPPQRTVSPCENPESP